MITIEKDKEECAWLRQEEYCTNPIINRKHSKLRKKYAKSLEDFINIDSKLKCPNHYCFSNIIQKCPFWDPKPKRTCQFCEFNTFESPYMKFWEEHNETDLNLSYSSEGICSIFKQFIFFPLQKPCPFHTYKLWLIPNPPLNNSHICPYCKTEAKKNSGRGIIRLQEGKKYNWFHSDCLIKNDNGDLDNLYLRL